MMKDYGPRDMHGARARRKAAAGLGPAFGSGGRRRPHLVPGKPDTEIAALLDPRMRAFDRDLIR
jgi:hypothetical protein